jgi:hypothetical protein
VSYFTAFELLAVVMLNSVGQVLDDEGNNVVDEQFSSEGE